MPRKPIVLRNIIADMTGFDWEIYLLNYPELVQKGIRTKADACKHYKEIGFWEKRSCSISDKFDAQTYLKTYGHLGLKTARDAYIHFMRIGTMVKKNDGVYRQTQAYKMPATRSAIKRALDNKFMVKNAPVVAQEKMAIATPPKRQPNTIVPSLMSIHGRKGKHQVKQPKPGELVLHEPPSSYFAKICVIGPPKILNKPE